MAEAEIEEEWATWTQNKTSMCYAEPGANEVTWCGELDKCSTDGLVLPLFFEGTWPREARATIYLIALLYSFLGVSIIADIFMCSIEKITSKTKKIHIASSKDDEPEVIEVPVWNGTVANLTLMALGSSAPEILLSCIEIIKNKFEAGSLGPGTIVGSAAFNLLAISAVCIAGIPKGETRRINQARNNTGLSRGKIRLTYISWLYRARLIG
jgi:solute carrier family 8 (sodium/calcium exchanger)